MSEFGFAEYAIGGANKRNNVFRVSDFHLEAELTDCYKSLFTFDETFKTYVDAKHTVAGYSGPHTVDDLVFDFDGDDLKAVQGEVLKFIAYLEELFELPATYVRLSFSGSKGFHVAIPFEAIGEVVPTVDFWIRYGQLAKELATGFKFIDLGIYDLRRLFRLSGTVNSKSGLFKIPLTLEEMQSLSVEEIRELARSPRQVEQMPVTEMHPVPALQEMLKKWLAQNFSTDEGPSTYTKGNDNIVSLLHGVDQGGRTAATMKLAGLYLAKGFDESFTLATLEMWNAKNTPPLSPDKLAYTVRDCFRRYSKTDADGVEIYSLKKAAEVYRQHVRDLGKNAVKLGYPLLDKKIRGLTRGEVMAIQGRTSVGKTALGQNIALQYTKKSGEPVLFFSMEMPLTSVFERTVQMETGFSGYEVESYINSPEMSHTVEELLGKAPNFYTVTASGLNLEQIAKIILRGEREVYRNKTGLVIIDYLGLIAGRGEELYQQVSRVARGLKDLAKELNVPLIFLTQVSRRFSETDDLGLGAARDSGVIDEASDFVLSLSKREKESQGDCIPLKLSIDKNRKGGCGFINVDMNKRSLVIVEQENHDQKP